MIILDKYDFSELAKHNETIAKDSESNCKAWSSIIYFYSAVHWVNFFVLNKFPKVQKPGTHSEREEFISKNANQIYKAYRHLRTISESYRYCPPDWKNADEEFGKIKAEYTCIKQYVNS